MAPPKFIVLESNSNKNEFLGYIHDNEDYYGYLKFSETLPLRTPYTKFELVKSSIYCKDELVHIKSCRSNKYLRRVKNDSISGNEEEQYWIAATADEPEDDMHKESCTVFELIPAGSPTTFDKIRIQHLQSRCYLSLWSGKSSPFDRCVMASHKDSDGHSRDVFTVIDCDRLARKAFTSPRFIVISPEYVYSYLGFIHEVGDCDDGRLQCSESAVSPYAKFEVEVVPQTGAIDDHSFVHIRSCRNNKYWVRQKSSVYVTAKKPAEDDDSALFKLESADDGTDRVRIVHVGSGNYLVVSRESSRVLLHEAEGSSGVGCRDFFIMDWESLLVLPPYVAFKGDNDEYLCPGEAYGRPAMLFASDDLADPNVLMQIFMTKDGYIRIKPASSDKFWQYHPGSMITVDADDTTGSEFLPLKVNNHTIALHCKGKKSFCRREKSTASKYDYLTADAYSLHKGSLLQVEVPVLRTEFSDIKYDLDNSRIYDEKALLVTKNSASNYTQESETLNVRLSYENIKTSTWMAHFSVTLGAKSTIGGGIPGIFEGKLELSGEFQAGLQFGETTTKTTTVEVLHQVKVPPLTKVTVSMFATKGKCDVPFTITRNDTLYDGKVVTSQVPGGTYTGSNYYSHHFETKPEPLVVSSSSHV